MATICNKLALSFGTAICATPGGTNGRQWVFQKGQFAGGTTVNSTTGALSSFTLNPDEKGIRAIGRAKKGSGATAVTTGENGGVVAAQTVISQHKYQTEKESVALMDFMRADAKVIFQETNAKTIRVYFWNFGSEGGTAADGTGTNLTDGNNEFVATITGEDTDLPRFFEAVLAGGETDQLAASRAYLDNLTLAIGA